MAEEPGKPDLELALWLRTLEEAYRAQTTVEQRALENYRRWDSVVSWLVGLCAGAIVAVGPALSTFVDLKAVPSGWLLAMYGCLLAAVILGVLQREMIGQAQEDHSSYCSRRHAVLSGTMAGAFALQRSAAVAAIRDAITDKSQEVAAAMAACRRSERWANAFGHAFRWAFFLALGLVAALAVYGAPARDGAPNAPSGLPRGATELRASETPPTVSDSIAAQASSDYPPTVPVTGLGRFLKTGQPYWLSLLADALVAFFAVLGGALTALWHERHVRARQEREVLDGLIETVGQEAQWNVFSLEEFSEGLASERVPPMIDPRVEALRTALANPLLLSRADRNCLRSMRLAATALEEVRTVSGNIRIASAAAGHVTDDAFEHLAVSARRARALLEAGVIPEMKTLRRQLAVPRGRRLAGADTRAAVDEILRRKAPREPENREEGARPS